MNTDDLYRLLRAEHNQLQGIVDTAPDPLIVLDQSLCVLEASPAFFGTFIVDRSETIGRPIYELGNGQWNNPRLRLLLEEVIPHSSAVIDFEVEHDFPEIGKRTMLLTARTLVDRNRPSRSMLVSISDATERRQKEAAQALLLGEVRHRMRNFLALAQALGHRATVEGRTAEDFRNDYMARLRNLIRSSELGFGGDCPTDLTGLIEAILSPYSVPGAIKIAGPRHVGLRGEVLAALGLVLHEAATNAAKYGALSVPNGQIRVTYNIDQQGLLQIHWTERGGPPGSTPKQVGFGSKLMTTTIKLNLGGTVAQHFGEEGLTLDITIPDALDLAPETE